MTITPTYASNGGKPIFKEFQSPVGVVVHAYHDKPQLQTNEKTGAPVLDKAGIQEAWFKITLAWPLAHLDTELMPMRTLAGVVVSEAWGSDAISDPWLALQPFLRNGNNPEHNTKKREYLFDKMYLNFKSKGVPVMDALGKHTGVYTGAPGLTGPYGTEDLFPTDVYPGCSGRVSGIMFGTEYSGKRFISTRLNNFQKAADGERIGGGGRPDAKSQFDALATGPKPGALGSVVL